MAVKLASEHRQENPAMRDVFVRTLAEIAEKDSRIVMFDADLMGALNSRSLLAKFPDRVFNCGVAEANMAGIAAGLGLNGFIPFIHTFGTFASRRIHDQVFLSGAYAGSTVKIIGSDPGVTASFNGGTHMPLEDAALMRVIPGMTVIDVTDSVMLRDILPKFAALGGMSYMRMPRKYSKTVYAEGSTFDIGRAVKLRDGGDVAIFAIGFCVSEALDAAETLAGQGIRAAVYDLFTIKPLDARAVVDAARAAGAVVTAENHNIVGGLGGAVAEVLSEECPTPLVRVGVRDRFGEVGQVEHLAETFGIVAGDIVKAAKMAVAKK